MRLGLLTGRFEMLKKLAGIDPRSLAAFRIGLGTVVLFDLGSRAVDLASHYSDWGVLPRDAARALSPTQVAWLPLFFLNGSVAWSAFLFAVAALAALMLLFGFRTRFATLATWFLVICLHARNPMVSHGGDALMSTLLFWSLFLPLGIVWSVDQRKAERTVPRTVTTAATFAVLLQICLVYWFAAFLKTHDVWRRDHTATLQALHLDHLTTSWGHFLKQFPDLLEFLTACTFYLELLGPLLIWIPFATGPIRALTALTFVQFHLVGLAPAFALGNFPWVSAVGWLLVLPPWLWNQISEPLRPTGIVTNQGRPEHARSTRWNSKAAAALALAALALVIHSNVRSLSKKPGDEARGHGSSRFENLASILGIDQHWSLFAPEPATEDGWFVVPALLSDGSEIDLWTGNEIDFSKPRLVVKHLRNSRWNKYLINVASTGFVIQRPLFTDYLCRAWNKRWAERRAIQLDLVFMLETYSRGSGETRPTPIPMGRQICDSRPEYPSPG